LHNKTTFRFIRVVGVVFALADWMHRQVGREHDSSMQRFVFGEQPASAPTPDLVATSRWTFAVTRHFMTMD
jgi:hypothetical protein